MEVDVVTKQRKGDTMKIKEILCWRCEELTPYSVNWVQRLRVVYGKMYTYTEKHGICDVCHSEITVPGLDDENERTFYELCRPDLEKELGEERLKELDEFYETTK